MTLTLTLTLTLALALTLTLTLTLTPTLTLTLGAPAKQGQPARSSLDRLCAPSSPSARAATSNTTPGPNP